MARGIFLTAGEELADAVEAAARRLGMGESEVSVSYEGSVLTSCALVRERFRESLRERLPRVSVLPPLFEPVVGAYLLGRAEVGWPDDAALFDALKAWSGRT